MKPKPPIEMLRQVSRSEELWPPDMLRVTALGWAAFLATGAATRRALTADEAIDRCISIVLLRLHAPVGWLRVLCAQAAPRAR
eukprot:CAMPEP_0113694352 /NCGR_PEP_ID=MMETSP0038_2-20120614/20233_1 /TAXON_ID=2898 /ORGANISM="Cryptomonas paramecium" /LENGTH=82 /DNA_ID=CAMNT_0000616647 /DNA_START=23 /DNA_END=267 /DNA_ORIENTATION=+ /assembly_acc=CAM_ASM_000170